jgi:hypothetical protein
VGVAIMADGPWVRSSGALLTRWITSSRAVDAGRRPFAGALSPGTEKCYRAGDEGNGNFVAASNHGVPRCSNRTT